MFGDIKKEMTMGKCKYNIFLVILFRLFIGNFTEILQDVLGL
jgi:hypothetical protein